MVMEGDDSMILKPRTDNREYKRIVLSNGLHVLLISDPVTDKAAASLDVHIGSFSNPEGLEGLAHFLEHMLFYATEKYPKEGTYKKFLSEHGGYANAYTAAEHTNYHFDVNASHLEEALDRFAQFFISPLLSAEATSREIHAVDSENSRNLTSDGWRLRQLQKHLSAKDHPYHKYQTGNRDTLDTGPQSRGIDTREELLKFYTTYYSAGIMSLAVYAREPITKLQDVVRDIFCAIRNNGIEAPRFLVPPCLPEHLQILVKSVPLRDQNFLALLWPVTPSIRNYKKGASSYVQHFLGHEAEGSLFALLRTLGWANSLSTNEDGSLDYAFFSLFLELTNAGQEHIQEVLDFTFQYIKLLQQQGVVDWMFEEKRAMSRTWFNYKDKIDPIDYVVTLSDTMHTYPVEDWLATDAFLSDFDANAISDFANGLQPQLVRIFSSSKIYQKETSDVEPWYGTPFTVKRIDDHLVKKWKAIAIDSSLHLPSKNVFLPKDLQLKKFVAEVQHPIVIRKTALSKLWYKHDTKFKMPKAYAYFSFKSPEANHSPAASLLTYIFTRLFADELNEYEYYAALAGLHFGITSSKDGFEVVVQGFHHKLMSVAEMIVERIVSFQIKKDRFDFVKEKVERNYANMQFIQPTGQAHNHLNYLLSHTNWHMTEYLDVLPSLDAHALQSFFPRLLSQLFVEAYIGGNATSGEACFLLESIEGTLLAGPLVNVRPPCFSQLPERRIVCLEPGTEWLYPVAGLNPNDENSAIDIYFQVGQDASNLNVALELFTLTAKERHFNQLRTVEQLGYIVELQNKYHENVRGIQVTIQSTAKDPIQLDQRVESFFEMYEKELLKMTEDEFQKHVTTLVEMKMEKHKNLWEDGDFYWGEIYGGSLQFDRIDIEVNALKDLKKENLINFFMKKIKYNGAQRKKLSVQVFGNQHDHQLSKVKAKMAMLTSCIEQVNSTAYGHPETDYKVHHMEQNGNVKVNVLTIDHNDDSCIAAMLVKQNGHVHTTTTDGPIHMGHKGLQSDYQSGHILGLSNEQCSPGTGVLQSQHNGPPCTRKGAIRIDNAQAFRRSQALYASPKVEL